MTGFQSLSVIGGGAWGTALANLAACNAVATRLWAREQTVVDAVNSRHENTVYLKRVPLNPALKAESEMARMGADAYLFVVPAQHARSVIPDLKAVAPADAPVALCSKGVENGADLLMTEVFAEVWPDARLAVLSGPSFARDVAEGLPTAITLACPDDALAARWTETIGAPHFRPYHSTDLIGAELGGAVKNVLAIAAGAVEGRGLGESARAALIARGFAEFQRLGVAMGAQPETMAGLSGLGDLILTATSKQSRNMSLGVALGRGDPLETVLAERNSVSEGVATAQSVVNLGRRAGVDLPICEAVADLVAGTKTMDEIITELLSRPFKTEGRTGR
ncbi:MAG: NAD(P)H-dependent glycerol-3-phosphate dehydrogenase [Pseudomonadota bacterium]